MNELKVEAQKDELVKSYLDHKTFIGGKKLFVCDARNGRVAKIKPEKEYLRHRKTKVIVKTLYVWSAPYLFYLMAKNLAEAAQKFEDQFKEMAEDLEYQPAESDKNIS